MSFDSRMEFLLRQRETWHKQLLASNSRFYLGADRPLEQLDTGILKQATDAYIRRRGLAPGSPECDEKLRELILEHARREQGGSLRVGFLACIHAMSREAALNMLVSMRGEGQTSSSHVRFLNCVVLSYTASPLHVQERECRVAQSLIQFLITPNFLAAITSLFKNLDEDPDPYLLPPEYIKSIFRFTNLKTAYQGHLNRVHQQRRLMSLHNAVSWLGALLDRPPDSTAVQVVSELLPHWRDWTTWKPDYLRLMRWEGGSFTEAQKQRLRPVFDLEGPDITGAGHASLKESVPGCFEYVRVVNDDPAVISRLLRVLDSAQRVHGTNAVELVIFLCIENPKPIDPVLLSLVEAVIAIQDDSSIHAVLVWLQSHSAGFNTRMAALTQSLPVYDGRNALQGLLSAYIVSDVIKVMPEARAAYEALLNEGVAQNLGMRIYRFSKAIFAAEWLHPALPPDMVRSVQRLPSEETLDEILDALEASQSFTPQINDYLRVVIGGQPGDADAMLPAIQKSIRFYRRGVRPDQANLAHAINNVHYLDARVRDDCLQQLLAEKDSLLRELLPIVRTESNMSCVDFASLLVRRNHLGCITHQCWYMLLFRFLVHRQREILSWSADELSTPHFFQWVHDLRVLFPDGDGRTSLADIGFTAPRYQWWHLLVSQYGNAHARLEELYKGHGSLKWLWLQEVPEVTALLDVLQRQHAASPQQSFIISYLQPSIYAISLICASLSGLNRAESPGLVAFESLCSKGQQFSRSAWHRKAIQVLSYCWRQSVEISPDDREGLRMLTLLMGLNDGLEVQGIYKARQYLMAEYKRVLASARELQDIAARLRNHSPTKTAVLLKDLSVEDIGPPPPTLDSDIPVKLSAFIESLGDRHWELCVPLDNLNIQKRQSVGIDPSSRLLLIRISLPRHSSPPNFCIHFHPNDDDSQPHLPHPVADVIPENAPSCSKQKSLFNYLLSRALYTSISQSQFLPPSQFLSSIYSTTSSILASPSLICPVCTQPHHHSPKIHRPTTCTNLNCIQTFSRAPLEVRAHHLLSDPAVLKFMLACILATSNDTVPDMPNKADVINSFPSLSGISGAGDALARIQGYDQLAAQREKLLGWMSESFRGCLVSAPAGSRIPAMGGRGSVGQFVLRNGRMETEGREEHTGDEEWEVRFFTVKVEKLWEVACEGVLKGDDVGEGEDEIPEFGGDGLMWERFREKRVVLGCEVIKQGGEVKAVKVRYVFICEKGGWAPPKMRVIGDAMRQSIEAMRRGRLVKE